MQISFRPSPELYPFESRWFDSPAGRVHYVDEGRGQPILLLHGNPMWSFLYRQIIRRLRGDLRCVALDYPGFGLSERPAGYDYTPAAHAQVVTALVRHLELRNLLLMGQDWGGPVGLGFAVSEAARISGLVFGNTWFWPADTFAMSTFSRVMSTGLMQRAILKRNFFVERLVPMGTRRRLSPAEMDHYRGVQPSPEARVGVAEFPRQIRAAGPWLASVAGGVERELAQKPLLLVWGMRDPAFKPSFMARWRRTFADHRVVELPQAKHYIQEDAPEEIAQAIRERFG